MPPPLLTLQPSAGMRTTSTLSRAASSSLHSSTTVGQPVVAPSKNKVSLVRPASAAVHGRRRAARASAQQAVPLVTFARPEPEEEQLSAALPLADLGLLWPAPEADGASTPPGQPNSDVVLSTSSPEEATSSHQADTPTAEDALAALTDSSPLEALGDDIDMAPTTSAPAIAADVYTATLDHITPVTLIEQQAPTALPQPEALDEAAAAGRLSACTDASAAALNAHTAGPQQPEGLEQEHSLAAAATAAEPPQQQDAHEVAAAPAAHAQFCQQWAQAVPFYPQQHSAGGEAEQPCLHAHHQGHLHTPYMSGSMAGSVVGASSSALFHKDANSVTVKADTKVKDAAGAIVKVLDRLCSTLVTALQPPHPRHPHVEPHAGHCAEHQGSHEALNRAVKALAVCRKYVTDASPAYELGFLPVNRSDAWGRVDPSLFSFLAFKSVLQPGYGGSLAPQRQGPEQLQQLAASSADTTPMASSSGSSCPGDMAVAAGDTALAQHALAALQPELHVSSSSDPATVATTLVRAVLDQGQAIMKAGGGNALFVAMTAVVQARAWLKGWHSMDILLVPQWITEDTRATLGRESKFVQFNVLPSGLHGVLSTTEHGWTPAIVPMSAPSSA